MTLRFFKDPRVIEDFRRGPLGAQLNGFASHLDAQGYSRHTGRQKLFFVRALGRWLERKGLDAAELNEERLAEFIREHWRKRRLGEGTRATLAQFLRHIREVGVAPTPKPRLPRDAKSRLERSFAEYLTKERGLCHVTTDGYLYHVRLFLAHQCTRGPLSTSQIRAKDLNAFVLRRARRVRPKTLSTTVTALRSFCRFLLFRGDLRQDLSGAVLAAPNWRLISLPKWLALDEVTRLLQQCDQQTMLGQRNFTILLILARLGLRAKEIVLMTLDDIDWEAGELIVRGKGPRQDRLPLPCDVGRALATYVRRWRPQCPTRRLFLCVRAPFRGFRGSQSVCAIVRMTLARAGLHRPISGAHLLRFTLAAHILRRGGSLREASELLRHRHPDTTALYTKIDLESLRTVAPRWPGVTQ